MDPTKTPTDAATEAKKTNPPPGICPKCWALRGGIDCAEACGSLTLAEARRMADWIHNTAPDDPEALHSEEDALRHLVLTEIVHGSSYAKELAEVALSTSKVNFPRWCA